MDDVAEPYWLVANLGDSRGYLFADHVLAQLTVDHSLVQELVDAGTIAAADAAGHPDRHIVTRNLGGPVRHEPDLFIRPAEVSGRMLLCSDGVSEMLAHDDIARILDEHPDPAAAAGRGGRGCGGRRWSRQRNRRRRGCGGIDQGDAARHRRAAAEYGAGDTPMSAMSSSGAAGAWSYRTGPWFAAFGPRVTVLLPESQRDQVVGVWSLVDGGAAFDEVLDALLASGLSRLPEFVLVSSDDGPTRVLLRGTGVSATLATDGDDVTLDGSASGTWVERSVEGVTSLSVALSEVDADAEHAATDFTVVTGLVRVSRIDRPPYVEPAAADEAAPVVAEETAGRSRGRDPAGRGGRDRRPRPRRGRDPAGRGVGHDRHETPRDVEAEGIVVAAPFGGAMADDATTGDEVEQATDSMSDDAVGDRRAVAARRAGACSTSPRRWTSPPRWTSRRAPDEAESVMPTGGDPLTDPMPPAPAPSGWVTPWDTPPPPVDAPASEVPEPATGDDDLAMTQQMPPLDDPMADDAMADDADG